MPKTDVYDFHGGSSDVPVWSTDGAWIYYTAKVGQCVELMRVTPDGEKEQLTHSITPGSLNYQPKPSTDGKWILFGSTSSARRQIYVMPAAGGQAHPITNVGDGWGALWGYWNPTTTP